MGLPRTTDFLDMFSDRAGRVMDSYKASADRSGRVVDSFDAFLGSDEEADLFDKFLDGVLRASDLFDTSLDRA